MRDIESDKARNEADAAKLESKNAILASRCKAPSRRTVRERTLLLLRSEGRLRLGRVQTSFASALGLHCRS